MVMVMRRRRMAVVKILIRKILEKTWIIRA